MTKKIYKGETDVVLPPVQSSYNFSGVKNYNSFKNKNKGEFL